jgi:hypothetical protein
MCFFLLFFIIFFKYYKKKGEGRNGGRVEKIAQQKHFFLEMEKKDEKTVG